jgi:hypothetical protein
MKNVQYRRSPDTAWTPWPVVSTMRPCACSPIKKLDDAFGQFLVRVICDCGACREIEPEALALLVGWKMTLKELAPRMRCSRCGKNAAEVMAVAWPRPRKR